MRDLAKSVSIEIRPFCTICAVNTTKEDKTMAYDENKSLEENLMDAGLGLVESDFGFREFASDLHVKSKPGVLEWLKANYKWYSQIKHFIGADGSDWAGQPALDIPFANARYWRAKQRANSME